MSRLRHKPRPPPLFSRASCDNAPRPVTATVTPKVGVNTLLELGLDSRVTMNDRATPEAFTGLSKHLSTSRRWVGAQFSWVLAFIWGDLALLHFERIQRLPEWLSTGLGVSYRVLVLITASVVQAGMLRSLMRNHGKHIRLVWGTLALILLGLLYLIALEVQDYLPGQIPKWLLAWVVMPAIFFPFIAASSLWGWRLPWRSILRVLCEWRWWLCVLLIGKLGALAEIYFDRIRGYPRVWDVCLPAGLRMGAIDLLETGIWVLLLGWLTVLFEMNWRGIKRTGEGPSPLPLPHSDGDAGGYA